MKNEDRYVPKFVSDMFLLLLEKRNFSFLFILSVKFRLRIFDSLVKWGFLFGTEIVDRNGKSSLLSLVKAFDSVLAVYEGFCNLKQVTFSKFSSFRPRKLH